MAWSPAEGCSESKPGARRRSGRRPRVTQFTWHFAGWFLLACLFPSPATRAEFTLRRWSTDDGLPHASVRTLVRTRDGYLWVGTAGGLARFDGHAFTAFTAQNTPAFVSDQINKLVEDADGRLWIATLEGLLRYQGGTFTRVEARQGVPAEPIHDLCLDVDGTLWVTSESRVLRQRQERFELVEAPSGGPAPGSRVLATGSQREVWVGGWGGLWRYADGVFQHVPTSERVQRLAVDPGGRPWYVDTTSRLYCVTNNTLLEPPEFVGQEPGGLAFTPTGELLVGSRLGALLRWNGEGTPLQRFELGLPSSLSRIRTVEYGGDGQFWVGLESGGLVYLQRRTIRMLGTEDGLPVLNMACIAQPTDGQMLVGTLGQGAFWLRSGRFERALLRQDVLNVTSLAPAPESAWGIGSIWGGLQFWQGATTRKIGQRTHARQVISDGAEGYWVATASQGIEHVSKSRTVTGYTAAEGLASDRTFCLLLESPQALWIGTQRGLSRFSAGTFKNFTRSDGLGADMISCMQRDRTGQLWVGTHGGGLSAYRDGRFVTFTTRDGLLSDYVKQIVEDDHEQLWLGTKTGLMRLALSDLRRRLAEGGGAINGATFGVGEGLAMREMGSGYQPSALKARDGTLWFCSDGGLAQLDPTAQRASLREADIHIEQVGINGAVSPVLGDPTSPANEWSVPPLSRNVEIRYTAVSFNAPERIRFKYRLVGHDRDWVVAGTRRTAYYSELRPGAYRFEVVACNSDGVWNERGAALLLRVHPAVWQTGGFRWIAGLAGVGLLVTAVRFLSQRRLRQRLEDLEQRRAVEEERSRIAKDLHDELGASLTRIKLLGELVERGTPGSTEVVRHAQTISQTAQGLARGMDEIVWALNPQKDRVDSLTQYLASFAEEALRDTNLRLRLDLPDSPSARPLPAPVRHQLLLGVKEAIHNAVKHSGASEIRLGLHEEPTLLRVTVADNGGGLPSPPSNRRGNGLENMRARLQAIGGQCDVDSPATGGVRITFAVPVGASVPEAPPRRSHL